MLLTFTKNPLVLLKVILTGYEIATFEEPGKAAVWAIVMKEISHILLVCYSAFNPIACCGELLCRSILLPLKKAFTRCFPKKTYMESEFVQMKSIGVTINGSATVPMDQVMLLREHIRSESAVALSKSLGVQNSMSVVAAHTI